MDYRLIQLWNERVKPEDLVFHIGDFSFKETTERTAKHYIEQLNGQIIFIRGNHDLNNGIKTCIEDIRIHLGGKNLLLVHNPNESSYGFDLCLVGHIHNLWLCKTMTFEKYSWDCYNVGVDANGFRPVTINEILEKYWKWKHGVV
jgi:calcineurin-like phosphoesterase family protein